LDWSTQQNNCPWEEFESDEQEMTIISNTQMFRLYEEVDLQYLKEVKRSNRHWPSPEVSPGAAQAELPVGVSSAVDLNTATTTHAITA
jgi:hypothetical protein